MKEKLMVFGGSKCKGVSKKTGKDYDFTRIFIGRAANGVGENGSAFGYEQSEFSITDEAYQKLKEINSDFPSLVSVTLSINSKKQVYITDIG
tara:strand:+ start:1463 stop:1738 length:276 start_codon:yes stop_codon:yes gene_type:complete